jgi:tRNA(fMet)-specific endonuclease VapC
MDGKYLLDTNIVIALFARDASVQKHLGQADEIFLASVVLGELYYGAENAAHSETNIKRVDEFAACNAVVACDAETARKYGAIKAQLKREAPYT